MGCCQSDLKGEKQTGVSAAADEPQPMKKVATNFSTIDYDSGASNRRETMYAPHEEITQADQLPTVPETPSTPPIAERNKSTISPKTTRVPDPIPADHLPGGGEVKPPYKDIEDGSPTSPTQVNPVTTAAAHTTPATTEITSPPTEPHTTDDMGLFSKSKTSTEQPTMNGTTNEFSNSIDPGSDNVEAGQVKERKSLYKKYQDLKRGSGTSGLSDEELQKYTGKTRAELEEMAKTTPGVGGNQAAGSLLAGGNSGFGMSGGTGEGLGGWGHSESSRRPEAN